MTARSAVAITADDAAFLAAALRLLIQLLDRRYQRPNQRVIRLEVELSTAAHSSVTGTTEPHAAQRLRSSEVTEDSIDVTTAATLLGCSRENVRGLCRREVLPAQRIGSRWLIARSAVTEHLTRREETQCPTSPSTSTAPAATSQPAPPQQSPATDSSRSPATPPKA